MTTYLLAVAICLTLLPATQQQFQKYERYCSTEQQCYITPSHRSWSNSQQWCERMNATLPIVDSSEKQAVLVEAMKSMGLTEVWIGAMAIYGDWTWVNGSKFGDSISLSMTPEDFIAGLSKPLNMQDFVVAHSSLAISKRPFICQFSGSCNGRDLRSVATETSCYFLYYYQLPWFSARNQCLKNGGDLATFRDISHAITLVDNGLAFPSVGLRNRWWNWHNAVSGTLEEVLFTQWSSNEPNNTKGFNCISTNSNGWKETDCEQKLAFICQQQNNGLLPVTSTVSSNNGGESTAQIGSCKNVGIAAGLGVGIPLIVIAAIIIVVIIKRDKLRTQNPVSSATVYDNESVADVIRNIQREQTQEGGAYEGLDSRQKTADDEAYEALDMQ